MPRLTLWNGFRVQCHGQTFRIPLNSQRVLAFVALHDRDLLRTYVSNTLWPDTSEDRASANLRSALWRVRTSGLRLIESTGQVLWLAPTVVVDVREMERLAVSLLHSRLRVPLEPDTLTQAGELMPGFYDEWVLSARERLRQVRLRGLEALSTRLTSTGDYGQAVEAGLAAVAEEPLRESAQAVLIRAYVAEGNRADAIRQFERYRRILRTELGLDPSPELYAHLEHAGGP